MRSPLRVLLFCWPFLASAAPVTWTLSGVHFTDGSTASGSFTYDADLNLVSGIHVISSEATYLFQASTFPVEPFEFVFVPTASLSFGASLPALVLVPSLGLTDAGGTVPLCCAHGFSDEGVICHDDCSGVTTSHQLDAGALTATAVPEPSFIPLVGGIGLFLVLKHRHCVYRVVYRCRSAPGSPNRFEHRCEVRNVSRVGTQTISL